MEGIKGKKQPIGDVQRTDKLRSYREQGTMGPGTVLAQRGHALLSCCSLESAPTFSFL